MSKIKEDTKVDFLHLLKGMLFVFALLAFGFGLDHAQMSDSVSVLRNRS